MEKYRRYKIESPRTGGGSVIGFVAMVGLTLGALVVTGAEAPPRLAHTVFIEPPATAVSVPSAELSAPEMAEAEPAQSKTQDIAQSQDVAVACSFDACASAYQSFRASDCTFQPYDGPRRMCTR